VLDKVLRETCFYKTKNAQSGREGAKRPRVSAKRERCEGAPRPRTSAKREWFI